jgi:hypothetical protein
VKALLERRSFCSGDGEDGEGESGARDPESLLLDRSSTLKLRSFFPKLEGRGPAEAETDR